MNQNKVMKMEKINDIKKLNYYINKHNLSNFLSRDVTPFLELIHFKPYEHICKEGEEYTHFFFFVEGKAKIYKTLRNGKALLLCFYQDFNVLGDVELIETADLKTNAQAINDVYCIGIPKNILRDTLLDDSIFLKNICRLLGEKLNRITNNSSINLLYPLENRLASYIVSTIRIIVNNGTRSIVFNENLTEIADLLGSSYRHLLRIIYDFCDRGILKKKMNLYIVVNEELINQLASDLYK
jgi:CRP-like cAMP-binding protein